MPGWGGWWLLTKHTGKTILATRMESRNPLQPLPSKAVVPTAGTHSGLCRHPCVQVALYIGEWNQTNIFFKYSSKPKLVSTGVKSRISKTICTGFIIWCLLSGVIKTWNGGKCLLRSLLIHCQFTAVVDVACPAGQATLPMPKALAPGKPLQPAGVGKQQSSH